MALRLELDLQELGVDLGPGRVTRRFRLRRLRADSNVYTKVVLDSATDPDLGYFLGKPFRVAQELPGGRVLQVEGLRELRDSALAQTLGRRPPGILEGVTLPLTDEVLLAQLDALWGGLPPGGLAPGQEAWQVPRRLHPWGGKWLDFTAELRRDGSEVTGAPLGEVRERSTQDSVLIAPRVALRQRWGPRGVEAARVELRASERWPGGESTIEWWVEWGPAEER